MTDATHVPTRLSWVVVNAASVTTTARSVLDGVSDLRRSVRWSSISFGPKPRPPNSTPRS